MLDNSDKQPYDLNSYSTSIMTIKTQRNKMCNKEYEKRQLNLMDTLKPVKVRNEKD